MAQAPTNFVLKAYATEALARAGGHVNALRIDDPNNQEGSIVNNPSQAANYGFWAFQRYWYRIESNEPVSEFHIDWDDGEDNSPKKANISIIKTEKPSFYGITSHIYTQSKKHYPLIRVKSIAGFLSKWYTPHAASGNNALNTVSGLDDNFNIGKTNTAASSFVYEMGQNSLSIVSMENSGSASAATAALSCADGDTNTANQFTEGEYLKITSTDGTVRIYVLCDGSESGAPATGTVLEAGDDTGHHYLHSTLADLGICVAVLNNLNTHQQALVLNEIKAAIVHANGHNGKITCGADVASTDGAKTITLTQATVGDGGHTTSVATTGPQITLANFTGTGSDFARIPVLEPANVPPVGVLKTDRKKVFSGIDNMWLGNNSRIYDEGGTEFPYTSTIHAFCSNVNRVAVPIKVTYQEGVLGGVSAISQVSTTNGTASFSGQRGFVVADLNDNVLYYKTMDETYGCYITWVDGGSASANSSPPSMAAGIIPTACNIATSGSGDGNVYVSPLKVALAIANALTEITYHSRDEFTATSEAGHESRYVLNVTHTNAGAFAAAPTITTVGAGVWETTDGDPIGDDPPVIPYYAPRYTTAGVSPSDGTVKQKTVVTNGLDSTARIENVARVLKVELVNNLENTDTVGGGTGTDSLVPGERVFILSDINDTAANTLPDATDRLNNINIHSTICSVSLGNPIVELDSLGSSLTADATESKIRCSNKGTSSYYIDDNKLMSGNTTGNRQDHQSVDNTYNITDKLVDGADFKDSVGVKDIRYSFEWFREFQDANYRFYPQKRLIRCQVEDDHTQVADDGFNRSPIVHWDSSSYLTTGAASADADGLPSEVAKHSYGAFLFTNTAKLRSPTWFNLNVANKGDRTEILSANTNQTHTMSHSTAYDDVSTEAHYDPDNISDADDFSGAGDTVGPRNALFMARKEKYDRIFVRVSHDRFTAGGATDYTFSSRIDNTPGADGEGFPEVRIQALYPAKKTRNSSTIVWKPLKIIDRTKLRGKDNSSLYTSGDITFIPPSDWEKTQHSTSIVYPYEDNFFDEKGSGTDGIDNNWNVDSYALIFLITMIDSDGDGTGNELAKPIFNIIHAYPYNNSHSQLIEIVDPMHVSLNGFSITQSVSFVRKGKYQEIKDRSGITQLRRVGAEGGSIKLGGVDLTDTGRAKFFEFQQNAVPVYFDITHKDSSITRLFGIMTDMSEDHPTGGIISKYACTMKITHILELDSSGNITKDGYLPLGGDIIDVGQYLSAS